jgi:hypothetical protein
VDAHNPFCTPATFRLLRAEYGAALAACAVLLALHLDEVRWWAFVALFAVVDVVGYLPGHLAWRRRDGDVPRRYYVLYDTMHSFLTAAAIAGAWALLAGPEWALLALPLHLCGDRALFGAFPKPFGVAFEPRPHPAYASFRRSYERSAAPGADDRAAPPPARLAATG